MDARTGKRRSLATLVLTVAVIVAAVLVIERFHVRLDLTRDGTYTLSQASRDLYKDIPERLRITYYLLPSLASRHPGPRQVEDFLRELEAASHGRITVTVTDPAAGKEDAAAIEALGVRSQQMQVFENNEQRVAIVYSGIVVQYLDRTETLPFVVSTDTLEFDTVKAIKSAISDRKSIASVLIGDGERSLDQYYSYFKDTLAKSGWEVREIGRGEAIPADSSVLVVLGNDAIDDYDSYRVDSWIATGGKALFAVKGVNVHFLQDFSAAPLDKDSLLRVLSSYGVEVKRQLVLDASAIKIPFPDVSPYGGNTRSVRLDPYPFFVVTRPENRDGGNPVTSRLPGLDLFWPSPLQLLPRNGVQEAVLVQSTTKAWLQTGEFAVSRQEEPLYGLENDKTTGQYPLVVTLSGQLPQAWKDKPIPTRAGTTALPPLPAQSQPSRIIVVGSSDFATDLYAQTNSLGNASFLAGAVEWLSSGDELVSIRSRGARDTRLFKIQDPAAHNFAILVIFAINLVLVPALVLVFALLRFSRRRKLARNAVTSVRRGVEGGVEGGAR